MRANSYCTVGALVIVAVLAAMLLVPSTATALGSRTIAEVTGVTRSGLISWLNSHRFDSYYLGTPYVGGDFRSPNGDPSFNGSVGMNCTGFVWHAFTAAGASGIPGIIGWLDFIQWNDLEHYHYYSKAEMLASGILEKGDVIWIWNSSMYDIDPYHHTGIFWGSTPSEDLFWHSHDSNGVNAVTTIQGKGIAASYTVIKTDHVGYLDLVKTSSKPQVTASNSDFSLAGAVFGIYTNPSATGTPIATITTDATGYGKSGALTSGLYFIRETTAPRGFVISPSVHTVSVRSGMTTRVGGSPGQVVNVPAMGRIDLVKRSGWSQISDNNASYNIAGASYGVYIDEACIQRVSTMTTNASGEAVSAEIDAGNYFVKETSTATGYALDETVYPVRVRPNLTVRLNESAGQVEDMPQHNPVGIALSKIDFEMMSGAPQGGATLAGAQFEVKHYAGYHSTVNTSWSATMIPTKTWTFRTDEDGYVYLDPEYLIAGDELIVDNEGRSVLPLGTITIKETKAPEGYLLGEQTMWVQQVTSEGTAQTVSTFVAPVVADQIKRGDIELIKAGEETYERLGGVPFQITSTTSGESHVIVTDANGYASTAASWNPHTQNTNEGLTDEDGVWFGAQNALDNSKGALPYDTYMIEELICTANADRELIPPFEIVIVRDSHVVSLGTLLNSPPVIPAIRTSALDGTSGTTMLFPDNEAQVIDTVVFNNLRSNTNYILRGILMDKAGNEVLLIDGEPIMSEVEFFTEAVSQFISGTVEVVFDFDASLVTALMDTYDLDEIDIVVFEYLYQGDELITSHEDIEDTDQTVTVIRREVPQKEELPEVFESQENTPTIVPSVETTPVPIPLESAPSTGDGIYVKLEMVIIGLTVGGSLTAISVVARQRKKATLVR